MEVSKRESNFSDEKKVGLAEFEVIEFNKELDSKGEKIVYMGQKDGHSTMKIAVTLKGKTDNKYYTLSFYLEDKEVLTKDGNKKQYINPQGRTTYADKPENLNPNFAAAGYDVAKIGEADLANFLSAWLDVNRKAENFDIRPDWKKLMAGNVNELTNFLKDAEARQMTRPVLAMATVRTVEKDGEIKEYQQIYNRRFLPGYCMKYFRTKQYTEEELDELRKKDKEASTTKQYLQNYEKFAIDITDPQYGCKDSYFLGLIKEYDPNDNIVAGEKVLSEENADY